MFLLVGFIASQLIGKAFLDGERQVKFSIDKPTIASKLEGKFSLKIGSKTLTPTKIEPVGKPARERLLPLTQGRIVLPGSFQSQLGGDDWDPNGEVTQMTETKPGIHELVILLNKGRYEYKIARDGSWAENYGANFQPGGSNMVLSVAKDSTIVKFIVDLDRKRIVNSIDNPDEVQAPRFLQDKGRPVKAFFNTFILTFDREIPLRENVLLMEQGGATRQVFARDVLCDPKYAYAGSDLGSNWSRNRTTFKVWSPVSSSAEVVLISGKVIPMKIGTAGTWWATVPGDLHGKFYQYRFKSYGQSRQTQDIYCRSASPDSKWSMVVDMSKSNPSSWSTPTTVEHQSPTDAIIYELSVRDFTKRPSSGVKAVNRGTYSGLVEGGTVVPGTQFKTGLDYLKDLGVTDIHLLPTQNFLTNSPSEYTWGYATNLFNVPEETYSSRPNEPVEVIREFKSMVQKMHSNKLRVVMDVVYNHTWPPEGSDSAFWETVPYYYVRTNDRGDVLNESGVGNALADERPMARKFVKDSLLYWMTEYKIDGFRFDLLGLHNPESVKDWAKTLRKIRPDILLYGEPWTGGGPNRFPKGAQKGSSFAVFNDSFRSTFRGDLDSDNGGFIMGKGSNPNQLRQAITGSLAPEGFTDSPQETINYLSAHDNMTLLDRISLSVPVSLQKSGLKLAGAAVLLSQGIPFIEGGSEIGRTKFGNHNSYNAGDDINGYDWERAIQFSDVHDAYRDLIRLRKSEPGFRLATASSVRQQVEFLHENETPQNVAVYRVFSGSKTFFIVFNGNKMPVTIPANRFLATKTTVTALGYLVLQK